MPTRLSRSNKLPLAQRLLEVCQSIDAIKFTEHNDKDDFDYAKASQLYEAFRQKLMERKILLLKDELELSNSDFMDKEGELWRETTIKVQYTILDCLAGDTIVKTHFGTGVSEARSGFGLYIAKTMGDKYFLRGIAMIPWAEGDQELQNRKRGSFPEAETGSAKKMTAAEKREDAKIRAWHSAVRQGHKTETQVLFYLLNNHRCESVRDLFVETRKEELGKAMAWAIRQIPNEEDVQMAVELRKQNVTTMQPKSAQPIASVAEAERPEEISGD